MNAREVLNHKDPPNGTRDQIINAVIVAGFNFFSTLASLSVTQVVSNPLQALVASGISAGLGFFGSLMVQRGITRYRINKNNAGWNTRRNRVK